MPFVKSSASLAELMHRIGDRHRDPSYSCGVVAPDFVLSPGKITVIGAPPATGKTALASQIVFEAMAENPELRLWIGNVEMDMQSILRREVSRRSGVAHKRILDATFGDDEGNRMMETIQSLLPLVVRMRHMTPPFTTEELGRLVLESQPGLVVVDYLQKFRGSDKDARSGTDEVINTLRLLAHEGWAVLAMSSTTRQQGNGKKGGHDHASLSLSSFKESGEIEFAADAAYILRDVTEGESFKVRDIDLDCVKNRAGSMHSIPLRFCGDFMRFERRDADRSTELDSFNDGDSEGEF